MKRLLLLLICCIPFMQGTVLAVPTVHVLYFADTKDKDIGESSSTNLVKMHYFADKLAGALGYNLNNQEFTGDKFSSHAFENIQRSIHPRKDDIIILYVSAKGIYTPAINGSFPGISFPDRLIAASVAHHSLSELPHHTLLTIIDAADHYMVMDERGYKNNKRLFEPNQMLYPANDAERARYQNMFNGKRFDAIASSGGNHEHALATEAGGMFTNMFLDAVNFYTDGNRPIEYANLMNVLERARKNTTETTQEVCVNLNYTMRQLRREEKPCPVSNPVWTISDNHNYNYVLYRTGENHAGSDGAYARDPMLNAFELDYDVKKLSWDEKGKMQTLADYQLTSMVKANPQFQNKIRKVKYYYHYTTPRPFQEIYGNDNFKAHTVIYDKFMLRAEVTLDDGTVVDLAREIQLPS